MIPHGTSRPEAGELHRDTRFEAAFAATRREPRDAPAAAVPLRDDREPRTRRRLTWPENPRLSFQHGYTHALQSRQTRVHAQSASGFREPTRKPRRTRGSGRFTLGHRAARA